MRRSVSFIHLEQFFDGVQRMSRRQIDSCGPNAEAMGQIWSR